MLRELRPADLATTVEELPPSRRSQIAAALDDEELADLLEEMPEQDQVRPASAAWHAAAVWW
jgi:Mg/Co/Ni transporter MgtE